MPRCRIVQARRSRPIVSARCSCGRGVVSGARRRRRRIELAPGVVPAEELTASAPSPTTCSSWYSRAYAAPAAPVARPLDQPPGSHLPRRRSHPDRGRARRLGHFALGLQRPRHHDLSEPLWRRCSLILPPAGTSPARRGEVLAAGQELFLSSQHADHSYIEAALPCFPRATSIGIDSCGLIHLTDRVLIVSAPVSHIVVHSGSLQALDVSSNIVCYSIDIATPMLKHLEIHIQPDTDLSVSVSAPMVEKVEWNCSFTEFALVFGFWHLRRIMVSGRRPIHALHLALSVPDQFDDELDFAQEMDFAQAMEKLPVTDFSILKLTLEPHGHVFGALVLHLFGLHPICAVMKRLIVDIPGWPEGRQACPENCPCDEPKNWRCQSISLTCLEEVLIYGFTGEDHEHDFLELIFRSSPMLNRVALKLVPGFRGCIKEIYDIFLANPSVKVNVYASNGGLVQRPSMFLS